MSKCDLIVDTTLENRFALTNGRQTSFGLEPKGGQGGGGWIIIRILDTLTATGSYSYVLFIVTVTSDRRHLETHLPHMH